MTTASNDMGRAYEYAWIQVLQIRLGKDRKVNVSPNSSLIANKQAWEKQDEKLQTTFLTSATAAVDTVIELEPRMIEDDGDILELELQKDSTGQAGDVRDILIKRKTIEWEVGLSVKHNHEAVKHSRLSRGLDFGEKWFGVKCSKDYKDAVEPIFDRLAVERDKVTKWSELRNKEASVYVPLLQAFVKEVKRACKQDPSVPRKLTEYLIGFDDYYKVVSRDNRHLTLIQTFNIHGTLNKPSKTKISAICVPIVALPTELVDLRFQTGSKTTVEMYLNNGWQLSFRIHSASTIVQPSLKFDVQFVGMPVDVLTIECKWNK